VTPDPSAVPLVVWLAEGDRALLVDSLDVMSLGIFVLVAVGMVAVFGIFLGAAARAFRS